MYLKSIELSGFKSFAKKSELKFTTPISAVVGPNGSGKSNIAEAFRFVLGEQSIKSLRGKRGEDLIFNGAGELPKANRASVKVIFDNSSKFLPVDFEEVSIERIVHRDSVNEYMINGSAVRLRDVVEMLASAHVGSSGHHIISQGEADRILNSSIKERKSMIEDALGLKLYQYKKEESRKKLEKTRQNIEKVESLRREISPHIKFLKKQVEKVEKAMELKNELCSRAVEYISREDKYISVNEKNINDSKKSLEEKIRLIESEIAEANDLLGENVTDKNDVKKNQMVGYENDLVQIRQKKDELLRQGGQILGEISSIERMLDKQRSVAESRLHKTVTLVSIEAVQKEIEQKIVSAKEIRDPEILLSIIADINAILKNFIDQNKESVSANLFDDTEVELSRLNQSKKIIEESLQKIRIEESKTVENYENLRLQIEREKDAGRDAEKKMFRLVSEREEFRSALKDLDSKEEVLKIVRDEYKRQLAELGAFLGERLLREERTDFDFNEEFSNGRGKQEERLRVIERLKIRLEESGNIGGAEIVKEYNEASERDQFLEKELTDLKNSAKSLEDLIANLDERLSVEFKSGLEKINRQFGDYFSLMFGGGNAHLSVTHSVSRKKTDIENIVNSDGDSSDAVSADLLDSDSGEETEEGIDIEVSLPKKKVKGLMMLSGGERALTSIALLFAISQVNPPPFVILDETDAALDEANSKKYGDMIESLSKHSQLILITHNRETMSRAGILYGITMTGGSSKILSVAFDEAVAVAK
jgi:chromosome segregation protein